MSGKERERLKVLARVKRGELSLKEAAELLSVSYRQCRRLHNGTRNQVIAVSASQSRAAFKSRSYSRSRAPCWLAIRSAIRTLTHAGSGEAGAGWLPGGP